MYARSRHIVQTHLPECRLVAPFKKKKKPAKCPRVRRLTYAMYRSPMVGRAHGPTPHVLANRLVSTVMLSRASSVARQMDANNLWHQTFRSVLSSPSRRSPYGPRIRATVFLFSLKWVDPIPSCAPSARIYGRVLSLTMP